MGYMLLASPKNQFGEVQIKNIDCNERLSNITKEGKFSKSFMWYNEWWILDIINCEIYRNVRKSETTIKTINFGIITKR